MARRRILSTPVTPKLGSLFAEPKLWQASEIGAANFARCMKVSRSGRENAEAATITVPTEMGANYILSISCADVVGKLQIFMDGKALITSKGTGKNSAKFTADKPSVTLSIRCVDRMDACGTITELSIDPA